MNIYANELKKGGENPRKIQNSLYHERFSRTKE